VIAQTQLEEGADLNAVLAAGGWTVLELPSSMHKPGELFKPGASTPEATCVDAAAVQGELPSIEAQGSKGFVVEGGARKGPISGGAGLQATSFNLKSFTNVAHLAIKGFGMKLNSACLSELEQLRKQGQSLQGWYVIQEAARAEVKEVRCSSKEAAAQVRAMWIARGEVGASSDCVQTSEVMGVIAYKARPVLDMLPPVGPTSAPIAVPVVDDVVTVIDGRTDIAALAAAAAEKQATREAAEQQLAAEQARLDAERARLAEQERKAKAALQAAQHVRLDKAAADLRARAAREFTAIKPLLTGDLSPEIRPVLQAFSKKYTGAKVRVAELEQAVRVPGLSEVDAALSRGSASSGGTNSIGMTFVAIAAGSFQMGDGTQHRVSLTKSFLMATTEVTQGQWRAVMGSNPSDFSSCGADCPVEDVSWFDAVKFANALSKKEGLRAAYRISGKSVSWDKSANGYRLPTEAEWEYAARGGEEHVYSGSNTASTVGWTSENSGGKTHKVAGKRANAWGLYDMSGNVWEWCWDWYGKKYGGSSTDPVGPQSGDYRVRRGGSWLSFPASARVANRYRRIPDARSDFLGLRLVRTNP
jgi:formylglycine-generating enzyme required for sulfatase activity